MFEDHSTAAAEEEPHALCVRCEGGPVLHLILMDRGGHVFRRLVCMSCLHERDVMGSS